MILSKYATLERICRSTTAIRHGIANTPTEQHLNAIALLAEKIYDPLCQHFGFTIPFTSWYRSRAVNTLIGGSGTSQHTIGEAVDLDVDGSGRVITNSVIFHYIANHLEFDQLIWEYGDDRSPAWVHVSFSAIHNRRQVLRIKSKSTGYQLFTP